MTTTLTKQESLIVYLRDKNMELKKQIAELQVQLKQTQEFNGEHLYETEQGNTYFWNDDEHQRGNKSIKEDIHSENCPCRKNQNKIVLKIELDIEKIETDSKGTEIFYSNDFEQLNTEIYNQTIKQLKQNTNNWINDIDMEYYSAKNIKIPNYIRTK